MGLFDQKQRHRGFFSSIDRIALEVMVLLCASVIPQMAFADQLAAVPSSTEVEENENISVEFRTTIDTLSAAVGRPVYEAPDFDEVNAYGYSSQTESRFINGKIETRQIQSVVSVLRPKHKGKLVIRNIHAMANGKIIRAPDLVIDVRGAGSAPAGNSRGLVFGGPTRGQLPQSGVQRSRQAGTFFLKTEPNKLKVYKGEQVMLTYSIYTRVPIVNVQVERFPNLTGFLKEDIDVPVLRGRWDFAPSVVNGHEYRRAPLAQYAIFPLKDGTLPLDIFTGKFSYQADNRFNINEDDPFGAINQFFRAMQTTTETRSSDRVSLDVLPLPAAGQPANFSGLVGDFDITAVADKYTVKAGEPINIKVKLEGKGHAGSLERLNVSWPQDFELYEDKSNTHFLRTGYSERLFEYMVIPKVKGRFEIPAIEVSMFNPDTKSYQARKTQPIAIEVLEGSLGNIYVAKGKVASQATAPNQDIRYWMEARPSKASDTLGRVSRGVAAASVALAFLSIWSLALPSREERKSKIRASQELNERLQGLLRSTSTVAPGELYGQIEALLADALELCFGIHVGSLTRAEVKQAILGRVDDATATRIERLFELCENQRYVPGGGDRTAAESASVELERLINHMQKGCRGGTSK